MRKPKFIILCLCILIFCVGCSPGNGRQQEIAVEKETETDPMENLIVVGVTQVGSESDWRIAHTDSIRAALTADNGFYLIFEDAQQKQENQLKAIRSFIMQEVDYIVVCPIVETGWDAVLQEAKDAGIPVILLDRRANVPEDLYTCWIGADFEREGEEAGHWLEEELARRNRADDRINLVTLQGTLGASAQIGRTEGFNSVLQKHDNWHMLEMMSGDFTQAKGQEAMEELLVNYDNIDVVVCENDNMAFGAVDAIKEAGLTCGSDGDIMILSFDAVRAALEAMIAGDINAVFECNPLHGPKLAEVLKMLDAGEKVDKIQYMEETYFDTSMDLEKILVTRTY